MYICIFFLFVFVLLYQFIYTLLYKGENHGLFSRLNDTRLCPFLLAKPFIIWSRIAKILFSLKLLFAESYISRKQHSDKSMKQFINHLTPPYCTVARIFLYNVNVKTFK